MSTELLLVPQQLVTRGFLELAEEARIVKVEKKQSFLVEEVLPQITEVTRPMCEPVSWTIEEDLGQSVESLGEGAARVPTVRFDVGQLMQWPDINSAGVMICGFMLESEMFSLSSVRLAAEPVSVATKSEMLTPVFAWGVVAAAAPLVVVEAVTSRVSVLPVIGSDIQTGLSVAAGGADQFVLFVLFVLFRWNIYRSYVKSVILCSLGCGQWPSLPVSFSCRMKGKMWKCPYTLMMVERYCNGWTSIM